MRNYAVTVALACCGLLGSVRASPEPGYQTATVMRVVRLDTMSPNYVGGNPTDAPTAAKEYAYAIGLKVNCTLYVGRYDSATNYLPTFFRPQNNVDVRLGKHWIYVSLPSDREVKLGLMSHRAVRSGSCAQ